MIKTLPMNHMDMERKRCKSGPKTPQNYIVHPMLVPVLSYFISYPAFYTKIGPMTRISALYPGAYAPDIDRREISGAYAPGYSADIRVIRPNYYIWGIRARGYPQISEHMTQDPCAQPFPRL